MIKAKNQQNIRKIVSFLTVCCYWPCT